MATPVVPQRPSRSQQQPQSSGTADGPYIPPRPARHLNPSPSPSREAFARSPLNDSPFAANIPPKAPSHVQTLAAPKLARPPSVQSLPLIGQEGSEYAALDSPQQATLPDRTTAASPNHTSNVAESLPLHAPKAATPAAVAKTKISTVTRTDSAAAAAAGIGKAHNEYEEHDHSYRPPSAKPNAGRPASIISNERPSSTPRAESIREGENEYGIPHIGLHVPMYPNAGDVQAPSPSNASHYPSTGIGFFNEGKSPGHIGRKKSREIFSRPPDSYGLHGHGSGPADQFERAWYQRHPEEALKEEHGAYGPGARTERTQWALSSDDLNKLVHKSAASGMGTHPGVMGIPPEQIGYIASEEYVHRQNSPRPQSAHSAHPKSRTGSQSHAESPLRRTSFPINESNISNQTKEEVNRYATNDSAMESDTEDHTIHLDPSSRRASRFYGGGNSRSVDDLGHHGGASEDEGGSTNEHDYPILASDELAKDPGAEYMVPAVDREQLEHGDSYYGGADPDYHHFHPSGARSTGSSRPGSRPSSRPGSIHMAPISLSRFASHDHYEKVGTPLEEIEEYEPLFVDEETGTVQKRPKSHIDRLKRPDLELQRFPSRDIWEDTPNSLQLQTTVDSEQQPEDDLTSPRMKKVEPVFESPEKEQARQNQVTESQRQQLHQEGYAKPKFKPGIQEEVSTRPGLRQRFPSRDIWEDTPDSAMIETTVSGPQSPEGALTSPQEAQVAMASLATAATGRVIDPSEIEVSGGKPVPPPRPDGSRDLGSSPPQPSVPPRPPQRLRQVPPAEIPASADSISKVPSPTDKRAPSLPDRPKPQIPPRPTRANNEEQGGSSLSKQISASSIGSESSVGSPPKPKPAVPARPAQGSKLANIKAGFMDSLNSRLQKGPPVAPIKTEESSREIEEEEKAPLSDARKGRARGPARRKPAAVTESESPSSAKWSVSLPWTVFHISHETDLTMGPVPAAAKKSEEIQVPERIGSMSSPHPLDDAIPTVPQEKASVPSEDIVVSPIAAPEIAASPTAAAEPTDTTTLDDADDSKAVSTSKGVFAATTVADAEAPAKDENAVAADTDEAKSSNQD